MDEGTLGRSGRREWLKAAIVQDAALAFVIAILDISYFGNMFQPAVSWLNHLLVLLITVPEAVALTFRRRWPLTIFAIVWAVSVGAIVLSLKSDFNYTPIFGVLLALYTVARQGGRAAAFAALALTGVPAALDIWYPITEMSVDPGDEMTVIISGIAFIVPFVALAWGTGRWARASAAATERDQRELEAAREAVRAERVQIARELHDIVANAVAVIVLQAETARTTAPTEPARLTDVLAGIEALGRTAMAELRRMLRLLRTADVPVTEAAERRGLADLAPLLDDARRVGIRIELEVEGTPIHLDDSVDQTAYRLVQEAVTNIIKHAGTGSHASVRISWSDVLILDVVDDGAGRRPEARRELSTGHGLLGLAERIALFGGELTASPYRSGFRVTATLPFSPASNPDPPSDPPTEPPSDPPTEPPSDPGPNPAPNPP
ncbi:histidine kinase [Kitasatospora sp. NPDC005856]|uniref:histidine kinase n=1 Tax=Kitasatospora sp. NPDC005856 TaxID=3154566 RepID=UPI0033DAAC98